MKSAGEIIYSTVNRNNSREGSATTNGFQYSNINESIAVLSNLDLKKTWRKRWMNWTTAS